MPYPTGPWVRVVTYYSNLEKEWQNVNWFRVTGVADPAFNILTFASAYYNHFKGAMNTILAGNCVQRGITLYYNNAAYTATGNVPDTLNGDGTTNQCPNEVAAVVRLQSDQGGPHGRGRMFVGGVDEANTTGSTLSPAAMTNYTAFMTAFKGPFTNQGLTIELRLFSRFAGELLALAYTQVDQVLGHRRKRRPLRA